jgi:thiamine phosphate synthase YjbQ (UPF0047 family)
MKFIHRKLSLRTTEAIQIVDVTALATEAIAGNGHPQRPGDPDLSAHDGLRQSQRARGDAAVGHGGRSSASHPRDAGYGHNLNPVDGRDNAHAHLLGLFMNVSESIPIADGRRLLGGWQSIFFVEPDGPRDRRQLLLHLMGES